MDPLREPDNRFHQEAGDLKALRWLLYLYFFLLLFEGALRKWVFPGWSSWLLLVRDPLVVVIYLIALAKGLFVLNRWLVAASVVVGASFVASVVNGSNLLIAVYGLRTNLLYFPLIFLLPRIFGRGDVWKIGRILIWLAVPITLLAMAQFRSSPSSWINVGAGGDVGGQLLAAEGRIRPSGTFSFVTGMVSFLSLLAAFLLADTLEERRSASYLRWLAIPSLVLSLGLAGSRSALGGVSVVFGGFVLACLLAKRGAVKVLRPVCLIFAAYLGLTSVSIFREGLQIHQARLAAGGGVQQGVIARYLDDFGESLTVASYAPPFGQGLGMGTNVAAGLITGKRQFLLAESEWARVILESGPVLGYAYLLLRVLLVCVLAAEAWRATRSGQPTAMVLLGACGLDILNGQLGQPTTLGFAVFGAGLTLAMARASSEQYSPAVLPPVDQQPVLGRGVYAEMLHAKRRTL